MSAYHCPYCNAEELHMHAVSCRDFMVHRPSEPTPVAWICEVIGGPRSLHWGKKAAMREADKHGGSRIVTPLYARLPDAGEGR